MAITDPSIVTTTDTRTTALPVWMENAFMDLYSNAAALANTPYTAYPDHRVAPTHALESMAAGHGLNYMDTTQSMIGTGANYVQGGIGPVTSEMLSNYWNPYDSLVTQDTADELERRMEIQGQEIGNAAARNNAFGGSRYGIMQTEHLRNANTQLGQLINKMNADNYNQAFQRSEDQLKRQMAGGQAMGQLGTAYGNSVSQDVDRMTGVGNMLRGQAQQSLETNYDNYLREQQWPYEQLNFASGLLRQGIGIVPQSQATTQQTPGPSALQQGMGVAGTILDIWNAFK